MRRGGAFYHHPPDQHFDSLVEYLRHLVDVHGIEETSELWRSGREQFDELHAIAHDVDPVSGEEGSRL